VHDVVAVGAPRDGGDLDPGAAQRGERLDELELAPGELAGEHLQARLGQHSRGERSLGRGGRGSRGRLRRQRIAGAARNVQARGVTRRDHHRLCEFIGRLVGLGIDEAQRMVPHGDHVTVLHGVLLDDLAVDVRPVGAVQVLEERVVEDVDDQRVVPAHRRVVDADVVVREAPDRVALLAHVVLGEFLPVDAEDQPGHCRS